MVNKTTISFQRRKQKHVGWSTGNRQLKTLTHPLATGHVVKTPMPAFAMLLDLCSTRRCGSSWDLESKRRIEDKKIGRLLQPIMTGKSEDTVDWGTGEERTPNTQPHIQRTT
jgi:hypothetical protein